MKTALLSFLFLLATVALKAEPPVTLTNGSIAPDFTLTDVNGNTHTLYDYLNQGKMVILEFSATWCGICWNYHNNNILKNIYSTYGPNGTDEVVILFIEGDVDTDPSTLFGGPGSIGDWTAGTPYPVMDDGTGDVATAFEIFVFPTLYAVCPDGKTYSAGQASYQTWENWIQSCSLSEEHSITDVECFGENTGAIDLNVSGGFGAITYEWSNGATTENIVNLSPGTYSCTITEGQGHSVIVEGLEVTSPDELVITLEQEQHPNCHNSADGMLMVSASGGLGEYAFTWSNGQTGPVADGLAGGTYQVTLTDDNGCTKNTSFLLDAPTALDIDMVITDETSNGASDGTIAITVSGGTPTYGYSWNNGATTADLTDLAPGMYTLTVTDQNGCTAMATVVIQSFECTDFEVSAATTAASCPSSTDGTANLTVTGGDGPFSFNWSNGAEGAELTDLSPGDYTVTAVDAFGCETIVEVEIPQEVDAIAPSITCPEDIVTNNCGEPVFFPEPVAEDNCGVELLLLSAGLESGSIFPEGLTTQEYLATDAAGLTASCSFSVTIENTLEAEILSFNTCEGEALGTVGVTDISGGTPIYGVEWSTGSTELLLEGLTVGTYEVTVTDAVGCTLVASVMIEETPAPTLSLVEVIDASNGQQNGSIDIEVSGGMPPFTYNWYDETGNLFATGQDLTGLPPGTYSLIVFDDTGCMYSLPTGPVTVEDVSGTEQVVSSEAFSVSPNPAGDWLQVTWETLAGQAAVLSLYQVDGRLQARQEIPVHSARSAELDLAGLPTGLYLITLQIGDTLLTKRIVKQ